MAAEAIASHRLGIADIVLVNITDDETLRRQRDADLIRGRRNFDLQRRLDPGLRDWYGILARLVPDRVSWEYPREMPPTIARDRYDTNPFQVWMADLPRHATSP